MGQKVHPLGFRLVTTQKHRSVWFSEFGNYPKLLEEDAAIRKFFDTKSQAGGISKIEIRRTFDLLSKLQDKDKIGLIGCSNFSEDQLKTAINHAEISLIQIPLNPLDSKPPDYLSTFCNENQIKIVAYNVLAFGLLTGKFKRAQDFPADDRRSRVDNFKKEN